MSRLPMAPRSHIDLNPSLRSVEITIHGCPAISAKRTLGFIEKEREYFVKITIGNENKQTSKRPGGTGPVEWNENFIFHNVEKSTLTLGLYYDRALLKPKLVSELNIPLPEIQVGDVSPSLSRTATFRDGPKIQWTHCVKDSRPRGATQQTEGRSAADNGNEVVEPQELPATVAADGNKDQDANTRINQPKIRKGENDNGELGAVREAEQDLYSQPPIKDIWKKVLEALQAFKRIARAVAEALPFAKLACTIFVAIVDPLVKQLERDESMKALLTSLISFCNVVADSKESELDKNERLRNVLTRASLQIAEVAFFVRNHCKNKNLVIKAVKNMVSDVDSEIQEYRTKLEQLKDEFHLRLAVETEIKVVRVLKAVEDIAQSVSLDDIPYVEGAGLDVDKMCLDGTRTEVLEEIMEWISLDSSESRLMWLCGGAGTGKSTIAHTIAARFEQMHRLGSMFCFSETEKATRTPSSLFPRIARDLADLDVNIRHELHNAVRNKADRTTSSITTQFTKLILAPANAIRENLHGPIVIVIDALDESGTVEERSGLLQVLGSKLKELPPNFRVIITSRPDRDIWRELSSDPYVFVKQMHKIPEESTYNDITAFVRTRLAKVPDVDDKMCQILAFHARGLFQWARVACEFVRNPPLGGSPQECYEKLTRPLLSESGSEEISGDTLLDYLYRTVLTKAISPKERSAMERFKFVMTWVLTAIEPLSCNSLNQLFMKSSIPPKNCKAENVVMCLGSLLTGVDDQNTPIQPLHTSFRDFLTDPKRSDEFFVRANSSDVHLDMALASLSIMNTMLKFNICQLPTSHLPNQSIRRINKRIKYHIPSYLSYACRFWAPHFCSIAMPNSPPTPDIYVGASAERWNEILKKVHELLLGRVLYWLEVLSLLGASNAGLQQIRRVYSLAKIMNVDERYLVLIRDLEQFWSYFAKCIATSAAHIYISALPFSPEDSLVARNHMKSSSKTLSIVAGQLQNYPPCLNVLRGHFHYIFSVACSPDGTRIASGSYDKTIRIWNMESGEMLVGPLEGHTDSVNSIAFSPDGRYIVSGSDDSTILVWNLKIGEIVLGPLKEHTGAVFSVVYSPDGTLIASGSADQTIRIWNVKNGTVMLGPLKKHIGAVRSVVFSPHGNLIASGSEDGSICVWDVENGQMVLGILNAHDDPIWSVAFSPDGTRIASGSRDETIRIWNVENGELTLGPLKGHTGFINSVAFSPNGTRLVSTSNDCTIRVWNAENGQISLGPWEGHTAFVLSAVFSPDGTRLVSGSYDRTIGVWNTEHKIFDLKLLEGHTDPVMSVLPSPDGTRIISASFDKTIRVWNIENGEMVLEPIRGHTEGINCATLSPDGTYVASCSSDNTIRVWSVESGETALGPLKCHTDIVSSVSFSPDGSRIVSGSRDQTVRVWNFENGDQILGPLIGHTSEIYSAVFSPDSSRIVSAAHDDIILIWNADNGEIIPGSLKGHIVVFSPDGTFIVSSSLNGTWIWDAESGEMLHGPLKGHTDWVRSLAFSPDGTQFASGSQDGTICLWDTKSGEIILGPLSGHAHIVRSIAFSPDGGRIISGSDDASIRVWNVESIKTEATRVENKPILASSSANTDVTTTGVPENSWRFQDGWALGENDELLFYVPPAHQLALWGPRTELIISRHLITKLDLSRFVHGTRWAECFDSGADSDTP